MTRWAPRALLVLFLLLAVGSASAHSYRDPALRTVLDGVQPLLPAGVAVAVQPNVLDELVLTNTTTAPLEVLGADGEPFLQVSAAGVLADLASPDWYLTGVPEGTPVLPAYARPGAAPRWARVSSGSTWSEFDPRLRPPAVVTPELRAAGLDRAVATWTIPLRYAGRPVQAQGHVLFAPVRGGLVVAVTGAPPGITATALQGELPGLFLRTAPGLRVDVAGADGGPFLRFVGGRVLAALASPSWRADRAARGLPAGGTGWAQVGSGTTFTWLDGRLRYPHDEPPAAEIARQAVVQRWQVPVHVDGVAGAVQGTVTWVPRAQALPRVLPSATRRGRGWGLGLVGAVVLAAAVVLLVLRLRRRQAD